MSKNTNEDDIPQLINQPIRTLNLKNIINNNIKFVSTLLTLVGIYVSLHFIDLKSVNIEIVQIIDRIGLFVGFWIVLGILSSIGLGSGPKVARFVMASQQCGKIVQMKPHRWALMPKFKCPSVGQDPNLWNLFLIVKTEAIIWGLGTAIGELPPYLITKSARLAGQKNEEYETELNSSKQNDSMINVTKQKIFEYVKKHSFITILLMASIPNPLFDLAGLTCGHLLIDFKTFFFATVIGKSLIKVNIQIIAIILILSKQSVSLITRNIGYIFGDNAKQKFEEIVKNQQQKMLHWDESETESSNWIGKIWNILLAVQQILKQKHIVIFKIKKKLNKFNINYQNYYTK